MCLQARSHANCTFFCEFSNSEQLSVEYHFQSDTSFPCKRRLPHSSDTNLHFSVSFSPKKSTHCKGSKQANFNSLNHLNIYLFNISTLIPGQEIYCIVSLQNSTSTCSLQYRSADEWLEVEWTKNAFIQLLIINECWRKKKNFDS